MKSLKLNLYYIVILLGLLGLTSCEEQELFEENSITVEKATTFDKRANESVLTHTSNSSVRVLVNGNPLTWPSSLANPVNNNGYVMVYMRTIFERLGYSIQWIQNDPTRNNLSSVIATKSGKTIQIWVGDRWAKVNGNWVQASIAPYNNSGYVMVHSRFIADHSGAQTEWDQQTSSVQIYYYDELDYGFYFFDSQPANNPTGDAVGCQKYVQGVPNRFFDPTKPTIIYVHGNAPGSVTSQNREDFLLNTGGLNVQSHNIWKAQGWNVAIFYWIQLADEGLANSAPPANVEAKIYDHTNSQVGMRWRKSDGSFETRNTPNASVRALFAQKYLEIFTSSYSGAEIRVIGNSLGGNLTMAGLLRLERMGAPRLPSRVTLMDPFWTPLHDNTVFIGENQGLTSELGGLSAEVLAAKGIAVEYFRTSLLGANGLSERAGRAAAVTHFGASFLGVNHFQKHTVPVRQYLHSRGVAVPIEIYRPNAWTSWTVTGNQAASAATPNSRIRQMMRGDKYWNHIDGRETATMADDRVEIRDGLW